jgi:hypothetical protein
LYISISIRHLQATTTPRSTIIISYPTTEMLFSLISFALLSASAFALPSHYPSPRSLNAPVSWVTHPDSIPSDSDLRLEWQGGDGNGWQVYYIAQWPEQSEYHVSPASIAPQHS